MSMTITNDFVLNTIGEALVRAAGGCLVDTNNIVWKFVNGKWIGKRSVWTFDLRACWVEDTTPENVEEWWCGGKNADYTEVFERGAYRAQRSCL